ncbi:MAG: WYL domain-containing protein [Ruminococcus sp.]|nr:WYL domain-containing protein [Ruminococcus sp.]
MSGFSELIKSFDKTRDYVRDFFIYGFKVRNEFDRKSARTYDDEKRRVESWLGDFLRYDSSERGKQLSISVDSGRVPENPLYKAFYSKSFTDNDIRLHFLLTDILADGEALTVKELTNRLDEEYNAFFDEQTVRNKLKEYVSEGIFISEKRGKTDYFSLSPDTSDSFFGEYDGLDDAVKFFSEASEFGVAGNSMLKTAGLSNDIFLMKHNYIVHALEDEILLKITELIEKKHYINAVNFGKQNAASENYGVPLKIYTSSQTGRRYLVMYLPLYKRLNSFRLDFIKSVRDGGECPDYDKYAEFLANNEGKCFGVSFGNRQEFGSMEAMRITFSADEEREKFIIDRLNREKRCCTVEKVGENLFMLTAEVFDANEMMHWVKSFIGRIVRIEGGNEEIISRFYRDISRMHRIYCKEEETV